MAEVVLIVVLIALTVCLLVLVAVMLKRGGVTREQFQTFRQEQNARLDGIDRRIGQQQEEQKSAFKMQREELGTSFQQLGQSLRETLKGLGDGMNTHFTSFQNSMQKQTEKMQQRGQEQQIQLDQLTKNVGDQLKQSREEQTHNLTALGENQQKTLQGLGAEQQKVLESLKNGVQQLVKDQKEELQALRKEVDASLREMRAMIEVKLKTLQEENGKKLEEMRATVDEKLQSSVKDRFDHSFKLISGQLESVQKGLGEMQNLAQGVGDLQRVMSNVKTRGILGEIQLGTILEDILTPEQYVRNAYVDPSSHEVVEFAVKLPGQGSDNEPVLLPIDSKFPMEDYQRLQLANEQAGHIAPQAIENAGKQFENAVRKAAKDISTKYLKPPKTTDFALLFVPTEGLYAEILARPGLFESLRQEFKVVAVGPSTVSAFLSSLQMGFRTLAIQQRSNEVWELLRAVKTEFGKFGGVLAKVKDRINSVGKIIEAAETRTRVIDRKLGQVQELPTERASEILEKDFRLLPLDVGHDNEEEMESATDAQ